jgi:large-conductance mechanosensitive channel
VSDQNIKEKFDDIHIIHMFSSLLLSNWNFLGHCNRVWNFSIIGLVSFIKVKCSSKTSRKTTHKCREVKKETHPIVTVWFDMNQTTFPE